MNTLVKLRFSNEVSTITGYVDYIENNFYTNSKNVLAYGDAEYNDLKILSQYAFFTKDMDEKKKNAQIITKLISIIEGKIKDLDSYLNENSKVKLPNINNIIIDNDLQSSLGDYIESTVYDIMDNPNKLPYSELVQQLDAAKLKEQVDEYDSLGKEKFYDKLRVADYKNMLLYEQCKLYNDEIDEHEASIEEYKELQTLYSIFEDTNPINIYRQAFILLLTAFDAALFDSTLNLFKAKFFEVVQYINSDKKFSLKELGEYNNFDEFISAKVETILAGKYASDILDILHNYNSTIFFIDNRDCYDEIIEIVQRRNLHVHKNGLIDQRYLDKCGRITNMRLNEYAVIDSEYFNKSVLLLSGLLNNY